MSEDNKAMQKRIEKLVADVNLYNYHYHVLDAPIVSDYDYDKAYYELVELEKKTGIILPDSPTQRVGDVTQEGFKKYKHKVQLYSLDKAQNETELSAWYDKLKAQNPDMQVIIEYKFDGLRLALTYKNGYLVNAATRGNGIVGEDVTAQVKTIRSVPLSIDFKDEVIVEGEGIMLQSELEEYNKTTDGPLKNARNAVAGAIRNLDPKVTASRNLDFFAYGIPYIKNKHFDTQVELREFLKANKFLVGDFFKVCDDVSCIKKSIAEVESKRDTIDTLIDGLVIKINDINLREKLGYTIRFPKGALAYKFEAVEVTTVIRDVVWQVGRTGKLTPLAVLDPVDLAGATIRRATLNNIDDVRRKKVKINSRVFIRRSNEVIPEILGLAQELPGSTEINEPTDCPSCDTHLVHNGVNLFCPNHDDCPAQLKERIIHFCSRDGMNIEGIRDKTINLFYDVLGIRTVDELYRLRHEDLVKLDKFKDKKSGNLVKSIEKSKNIEFANFIYALGIANVGIKTAKDLSKKFSDFEELSQASQEKLGKIRDIGEIVANSIVEFFQLPQNKQIIQNLFDAGVKINYPSNEALNGVFKDKSFVLTGTLPTLSRAEATKMIEDNGGNVVGSVSANTDYVLAGESPGSKYTKAQSLSIAIISEDEFRSMLKK